MIFNPKSKPQSLREPKEQTFKDSTKKRNRYKEAIHKHSNKKTNKTKRERFKPLSDWLPNELLKPQSITLQAEPIRGQFIHSNSKSDTNSEKEAMKLKLRRPISW